MDNNITESSVSVDLSKAERDHYFPFIVQILLIIIFFIMSGLFSGLSLGLISLSPQELLLISKSGTPNDRMFAEIILPVRKSGSYLLCSLLLGNVIVNSAISILFNDLTEGVAALVFSSIGIVILGEIVPQAICVKKGLAVGARTIWITRFIMLITAPFSFPFGKLLDRILGEECITYNRKRLMELIKLTTQHTDEVLQELKIAAGAMQMMDKTVGDVMTKIKDVFMLPETTVLNAKTVVEILRMGYTRIPIYSGDRNNVVSLLLVKDLALLDPDDNFTVKMISNYHSHEVRFVSKETPLSAMLEEFKQGAYHLAMVNKTEYIKKSMKQKNSSMLQNQLKCKSENVPLLTAKTQHELLGIVTLEDVVEEILQAEIVDETDMITDNVNRIRRRKSQLYEFEFFNYKASEVGICAISAQMHFMTIQWLITNHIAFQDNIISKLVLERLVRRNVHKLEVSQFTAKKDPIIVYSKAAKLYTKNEPSETFILVLEGRVFVTMGNPEMTFEVGPWYCFGKELLDRMLAFIHNKKIPDNSATKNKNNDASAPSFYADQLNWPDGKMRYISFVPDFSATIHDNCTYLEISAENYLIAFKSTLITRNKLLKFENESISSTNSSDGESRVKLKQQKKQLGSINTVLRSISSKQKMCANIELETNSLITATSDTSNKSNSKQTEQ